MAYINAALIGDPVYAGRLRIPADSSAEFKQFLHRFKRQALHARKLGLIHPGTKEWISWEAETPADLEELATFLHAYTEQ
jgi:23S rRNA pseudouridine1911/1915/1917 synthase